jgi:uncharacterized protein YndB with AHSA1/START domain
LVVTHRYEAPPEKVFDAFLDPQVAGRFLFATASGEMIEAAVDARVGGGFAFTDRRPDMGPSGGEVRHVGEYLEIDRPRRLKFIFGVPQFDPAMTTVTIDIRPAGAGCELTLTHEGVGPQWRDGTAEGWAKILAGLLPAYEGVKAAGWA